MISLNAKQRKFLRGKAHSLRPVVFLGQNGVSEALIKEINRGLNDHELIKIDIRCEDQEELSLNKEAILELVQAHHVQTIGHKVVLYRESEKMIFRLP